MSDLRPKGLPVTLLDGVERDFLFTLAVVDEVQDHYNMAVGKVMAKLSDPRETYGVISFLAMALVNDSIRRHGGEDFLQIDEIKELIDVPLAAKLIRPIMQSYGYSLPNSDDDEEDDPNATRSLSS